jgi:hypothetical protein
VLLFLGKKEAAVQLQELPAIQVRGGMEEVVDRGSLQA